MRRILIRQAAWWLATVAIWSAAACGGAEAADRVDRPEGRYVDVLGRLEQDHRVGLLTLDQKLSIQMDAIKSLGLLPADYAVADDQILFPKGASPVLAEIVREWDGLAESTREKYARLFGRLHTEFAYDSPSGFFKLHYDTVADSANAVPSEDSDTDGIPDFVEKLAAYCDSSLERSIAMGYWPPPSDNGLGGDSKYDIYFEETPYYGYTAPEGPGPEAWSDYYSYIVLNRDFLGFPENTDPEGDQWGAAKVTAAHEFHHAVQYAYDGTEATWFAELDAVLMEEMTFDATNDCYNYLGSFFTSPHKSLMENSNHYYSCFIWGLYLAQKFDTSLMRQVWEGARYQTAYQALSDTLLGRFGWSQDSAFAEFAAWNYMTGSRDDGFHHEEASSYPLVTVGHEVELYPLLNTPSPSEPAGYGAAYVTLYPGSYAGTLRIGFNGSDSREWRACLVKSTAPDEHSIQPFPLAPSSFTGTVDVPHFEDYTSVTLIGVNTQEFSAGAPFSYTAEVLLPYELSSEILTLDSAVYAGGGRGFQFRVKNESSLYDIVDVFAVSDSGWIAPDTLEKALAPGQDTVFSIAVVPPQGTTLGETSTLRFFVQSWNNAEVIDSQTTVAKTVLQRGDVNFDGGIDIADLVYLVNYAFKEGPAPVPMTVAADFECSESVDIADIVALVNYMFKQGPSCPCNPY